MGDERENAMLKSDDPKMKSTSIQQVCGWRFENNNRQTGSQNIVLCRTVSDRRQKAHLDTALHKKRKNGVSVTR